MQTRSSTLYRSRSQCCIDRTQTGPPGHCARAPLSAALRSVCPSLSRCLLRAGQLTSHPRVHVRRASRCPHLPKPLRALPPACDDRVTHRSAVPVGAYQMVVDRAWSYYYSRETGKVVISKSCPDLESPSSPVPPCRGHTEKMELPRESPYARSVDRFMAQMRGGRRPAPSSAGGRTRADGQEDFGSAGKRTAQSPAPAMHGKRSEGLPSEGHCTRHSDNAEEVWRDIRKGREHLPQRQIICECCGFWVYVVSRSQFPLLCRRAWC